MKTSKVKITEILPYIRRYWYRYLIGVLLIAIVDFFEMIPPAAVSLMIDSLQGSNLNDKSWIVQALASWCKTAPTLLALVVLTVSLFQWGLRYLLRVCIMFTREYVSSDLRRDYFAKLMRLPYSFFDRARTGELMSLASNDVDAVRMLMGPGILVFVESLFYLLFVLILLASWHLPLTLYLMLLLPVLSLWVGYISRQIHQRFTSVQQRLADITSHAQESLSGIAVIKNFAREHIEKQRFSQKSTAFLQDNLSLARIQAVFYPSLLLIVGLQTLMVLWIGGNAVRAGELSTGELVGFFMALWMLSWPSMALGWVVALYQQGMASLGRITAILTQPDWDDRHSGPEGDNLEGAIEFQRVSFAYPETTAPVLREISFSLGKCQTLALVGPVGCGKTTLLQLLLKLYHPDSGKITIGGVELAAMPRSLLHRQIGYVPQETFLFSTTIAENIALGLPEYDEETIIAAAQAAAIHDEICQLPQQYQTMLGERGINLSGGQKQRVAIARALAIKPRILILDDCLASVDAETESKIRRNFKDILHGCTAVIATHRLTAICEMDHIIVLENGVIVEQGNHRQLLDNNGWYAQTYRQQALEVKIEEEQNE